MIDPFFNFPDWNADPNPPEPAIAFICDNCGGVIRVGDDYYHIYLNRSRYRLCEDCVDTKTAYDVED